MRRILNGLAIIFLIITVFLLLDIENFENNINIAKTISDLDKFHIRHIIAGIILLGIFILPMIEHLNSER